jgi:hypothetical protein
MLLPSWIEYQYSSVEPCITNHIPIIEHYSILSYFLRQIFVSLDVQTGRLKVFFELED